MPKRIGSVRDPFIVGLDPARRKSIEAALFADCKPKDILEEIWLSEIASITAMIEYYREIEAGAIFGMAFATNPIGALQQYLEDPEGEASNPVVQRGFRKATTGFDITDLAHLHAINKLIIGLRCERDRIHAQFERKRRALVIQAVRQLDGKGNEQLIIEDLGD